MRHSAQLEQRLLAQVAAMAAVDVHSHVPAAEPFARSLRDLLGYHYYTELAHSAGADGQAVAPSAPDERAIPALIEAMGAFDNTVQHSWLMELARELFAFTDDRLTASNWEGLDEAIRAAAQQPGRAGHILDRSGIEKVFLTNNVDEDLAGVDAALFVPSLRADAVVLRLHDEGVRASLEQAGGVAVSDAASLRAALAAAVERFTGAGARSVAISLPPGFGMAEFEERDVEGLLRAARSDGGLSTASANALQSAVLFALAGLCREAGLPFQVMCGALRDAYAHGVPQGADLPQAGDTLRGLLPLLNAFPDVTFCLSVLSASQAQELASYGWIFRNVALSGHWWYANVPAWIERDLAARIQCVPKTKLIGYYSDAYKLEFGLAKFNMYRRVLARVLARDYVEAGLGDEEDALSVARLLLRDNAVRIFALDEEA